MFPGEALKMYSGSKPGRTGEDYIIHMGLAASGEGKREGRGREHQGSLPNRA